MHILTIFNVNRILSMSIEIRKKSLQAKVFRQVHFLPKVLLIFNVCLLLFCPKTSAFVLNSDRLKFQSFSSEISPVKKLNNYFTKSRQDPITTLFSESTANKWMGRNDTAIQETMTLIFNENSLR